MNYICGLYGSVNGPTLSKLQLYTYIKSAGLALSAADR